MPRISRGLPMTLVTSSARTTSSNSGNLKDTSTNLPIGTTALYVNVTTFTGASGSGGFECYLETSIDGGTTWFVAERFATITTSTATRRIDFRSTGIGQTEVAAQVACIQTTTGAVSQNTVLSPDQRITWEMPPSATVTFGVYAISAPTGLQ